MKTPLKLLQSTTLEESIELLYTSGILDKDGKLSKKYYKKPKNWVSRADSSVYEPYLKIK